MLKMNLKAVASGFAALALVTMLSWTFVDASRLLGVQRDGSSSRVLAAVSALVR
jgi:hypothetical protein